MIVYFIFFSQMTVYSVVFSEILEYAHFITSNLKLEDLYFIGNVSLISYVPDNEINEWKRINQEELW